MKNFFVNEDYNKRVYESDNFVVIPSLGSLVEGWLLIVPKEFQLNFSRLKPSLFCELESVIKHIEKNFLPLFGAENYSLFEHGPSFENSLAGCGVDYAHLHFVPTSFDLLDGVSTYLSLSYEWQKISTLASITSLGEERRDYLYLRDQQGNQYFTLQENIPSQAFRKVIANYLGVPDLYDWKQNFEKDKIEATLKKLSYQAI